MLPLQSNILAEAELKNMGLRVIYFRPKHQGESIILNFHREKKYRSSIVTDTVDVPRSEACSMDPPGGIIMVSQGPLASYWTGCVVAQP